MTAPVTPDERVTLRALADAATEGPWDVLGGGEYVSGPGILVAPDDGGVTPVDAAFIAAARTAVPRLLDALDTAEAEVARLRAATSTAWDEDVVTEDVTVALRRLLPLTPEPALDATATAQAKAALVVVRRHLPARPDREVAARAWDEGFCAAEEQHDGYVGVSGWTKTNPYRERP